MALIVQKFGGASVANRERLINAARIAADAHAAGSDIVVVVSAQGDTTDELITKANEITQDPSEREMDVLLTTGEQMAAALFCMALSELGCRAVSLLGWQAGILTDRNHTKARIQRVNTERLESELGKNQIVVVAGFQGVSCSGDLTTLGRGGSDTSAVAVAAALKADKCQFYKDVDGIYTADPRIVPYARKLSEISYDEMLELATLGAQVLNNRAVGLAEMYSVPLEVLSSFNPAQGTIVKEVVSVEDMLIKGVTSDSSVSAISVVGVRDVPGIVYKIFSLLSQSRINVDMILQSGGSDGQQNISFTVARDDRKETVALLSESLAVTGGREVRYDDEVAKVSVVGTGIQNHSSVAATMFGALYEKGINVRMISTSEIKISVLLDKKDSDRAVKCIHAAFIE